MMFAPSKKSYDQPRQHIKKQRHYFANKGLSCQSYGFSSSLVWIWELDYKESWARRTDAFELWCWRRLLRVPWTARRSNLSILKEIGPGYSLEELIWSWNSNTLSTSCKALTHLKVPHAGTDWGQEEKGATEDERVGWHHWLNGQEFGRLQELMMDSEAGVLQSMGSQRVGHDWATKLNLTDDFLSINSYTLIFRL